MKKLIDTGNKTTLTIMPSGGRKGGRGTLLSQCGSDDDGCLGSFGDRGEVPVMFGKDQIST